MDIISQYLTKIEDIKGEDNIAADALSRINQIQIPAQIDCKELFVEQKKNNSIKKFMASKSYCRFTEVQQGENKVPIIYEVSTGKLRPFIPINLRKRAFNMVHKVAHPGRKATLKILQQRYFWPNMRRNTMVWQRFV